MEDIWLARAKRLLAISQTGLGFSQDPYDRERYAELGQVAADMLADLGRVPIERIFDLVPDYAASYATPSIDVRGALIEDGRILLVQEKTDQKWTLPGGFADVGLSAAENMVKEVHEEAGIDVTVTRLFHLRHKAKHGYQQDLRDFYKIFFLLERPEALPPRPGQETMDAGFFLPTKLPPLSKGRVIADDIHAAFAAMQAGPGPTRFD
ncbi:MAG: NUDIX hydrolase N-terminal domain-containing protein [Pseudomonadota bacterium]